MLTLRSEVGVRRRKTSEAVVYLALALLLLLAVFLNSWGLFAPDHASEVYYAPGRTLMRALFAWKSDPFLGQANFNSGVAPLAAFLYVVRHIGASPWVAVRVCRALLFLVAGWGAVRFFDHVAGSLSRPSGRITAGLLYVANPYSVVSGATLPILLPYALLPWLMLAFARSIRQPSSWRWPAGFALIFFLMGGLNAGIVPIFLLLGIPCYVAYAWLVQKISLRVLVSPTLKCLGLLILVSLYWIVPAVMAQAVGSKIAFTTERPRDVSATSSYAETIRLLGSWPLYGRSGDRLFLPKFVGYLTNPFVVLATFCIPIAAAVSARLSRSRSRGLGALLLAVGAPVMVGIFPPQTPTPFARVIDRLFESIPGAIGFRTTNKVGGLVTLGLVLLIALGVSEVSDRLRARSMVLRGLAPILALAVVGVAVFPAWSGLYDPRWRGFPRYWLNAAGDLDSGSPLTRVLILPGTGQASYRWGWRGPTDITDSLLSRPVLLRSTNPAGSPYAADFVAALDQPLNDGSYLKGSLPFMARYLGVQDVLVRNDMRWEEWSGVRPSDLAREIDEPGLRLVKSYGHPGENILPPQVPAQPDEKRALDARLAPLRRYMVESPRPITRAEAVSGTIVIDGDNFALPLLNSLHLFQGQPAFRLAGSMTSTDLGNAILDGSSIVLTDTNRRRSWTFHHPGVDYSATLSPQDKLDAPGVGSFGLFEDRSETQTVALLQGARSITATNYGSVFLPVPFYRPYLAFDGDSNTAWLAGGLGEAVGQSVTIRFDRPRLIDDFTLQPLLGVGREIGSVLVRAGRRWFHVSLPQSDKVQVHIPATLTPTLTIQIASVRGSGLNPVGLREISIPGVHVSEVIRLPMTFFKLAERLSQAELARLSRTPVHIVLARLSGNPSDFFDDEESMVDRKFSLPLGWSFGFNGVARLTEGSPGSVIDHLLGVPEDIVADSSSRYGLGFVNRASAALDDDPATAWMPASAGPGEYLQISSPDQVLDHIVVQQGVSAGQATFNSITRALLSINGGKPRGVTLGKRSTTIRFTSQRVHQIRFTIAEVSGAGGPVGISRMSIGRLHVAPDDPAKELRGCVDGFSVDGSPVRVQIREQLRLLAFGAAVPFAMCQGDSLHLEPGTHRIRGMPGLLIDVLHLSSTGSGPNVVASGAPKVNVTQSSPTAKTIVTTRADRPFYLVVGEGYDPRWRAKMDGRPLGRPIVIDGYSVGWRISDLMPHTFRVAFGPQRAMGYSLVLSCAGLLLVAALFFLPRRREFAPLDGRITRGEEAELHPWELPRLLASRRIRDVFLGAVVAGLLWFLGGGGGLIVGLTIGLYVALGSPSARQLFRLAIVWLGLVPVVILVHGLPDRLLISPDFVERNILAHLLAGGGLTLLILAIFRSLATEGLQEGSFGHQFGVTDASVESGPKRRWGLERRPSIPSS